MSGEEGREEGGSGQLGWEGPTGLAQRTLQVTLAKGAPEGREQVGCEAGGCPAPHFLYLAPARRRACMRRWERPRRRP